MRSGHYKRRCKCRKCVLKLEVTNSLGELIPGPRGPPGPQGKVIAEVPRSLKVQMIGSEIMPVIIQGFSWEADVLQPPGWPVPGTFTFYRATVLDQEGFSVAEMFNNYGGINHTQVDEVHTSVLAHYHNGELQDLHSVSSQTPGSENFLLAQTLHSVVIGDQLYFAISPNVSSLTTFNYTLGSIKIPPCIKLNLNTENTISIVIPFAGYSAGQSFCVVVTNDQGPTTFSGIFMHASCGGGGAGEESTNDGSNAKIGRAGGGGSGSWNNSNATFDDLKKGDIIEVFPGVGGAGGTVSSPDGKTGQTSFIKLNKEFIETPPNNGFPNPTPGGCPGKAGVNGGDGGPNDACIDPGGDAIGAPGGGGGAPLTNGVHGTPGPGGPGFPPFSLPDAQPGGTNPRKGGNGVEISTQGPAAPVVKGGSGGTSLSNKGSGGGGGGGNFNFGFTPPVSSEGGDGGDPGKSGEPGKPGVNIPPDSDATPNFFGGGGGGGGSGGLPSPGGTPVPGGTGGKGSDALICLSW